MLSPRRTPRQRLAKRILDLAGAATMLAVTAPATLGIAALIRIGSPGPVLERHRQEGRHGATFTRYRFRTTSDDDGREPTKLGSMLRRHGLDGLPSLVNVLTGTMSLVGPRPIPVEVTEEADGPSRPPLPVKPGVVSIWQAAGRTDICHDRRAAMDDTYVRQWTPALDVKILMSTLPAMVTGDTSR